MLLANVSLNYWVTKNDVDVTQLNTGLDNVSQNLWVTKNGATQLNTCLGNVSQNYWEQKMMLALNTYLSDVHKITA